MYSPCTELESCNFYIYVVFTWLSNFMQLLSPTAELGNHFLSVLYALVDTTRMRIQETMILRRTGTTVRTEVSRFQKLVYFQTVTLILTKRRRKKPDTLFPLRVLRIFQGLQPP